MFGSRRTAREIEIKLPVANLDALIAQLRGLGTTSQGRVLERNTLFDTPDSDFRSRKRLLRVRVETPAPSPMLPGGPKRTVITSKRPMSVAARSRYKQNLERELPLPSSLDWSTTFRSLGLRPTFRYEKY